MGRRRRRGEGSEEWRRVECGVRREINSKEKGEGVGRRNNGI